MRALCLRSSFVCLYAFLLLRDVEQLTDSDVLWRSCWLGERRVKGSTHHWDLSWGHFKQVPHTLRRDRLDCWLVGCSILVWARADFLFTLDQGLVSSGYERVRLGLPFWFILSWWRVFWVLNLIDNPLYSLILKIFPVLVSDNFVRLSSFITGHSVIWWRWPFIHRLIRELTLHYRLFLWPILVSLHCHFSSLVRPFLLRLWKWMVWAESFYRWYTLLGWFVLGAS